MHPMPLMAKMKLVVIFLLWTMDYRLWTSPILKAPVGHFLTCSLISSLVAPSIFTETDIVGISQPFRSIYMRRVARVHVASDDNNNVYGSGPLSFPPELSGSSAINFPCLHVTVHLYFSVPMPAITGCSRLYFIV